MLGLLAAIVIALLGADRWQAQREFDGLLARASDGQATVSYAERRITAVVDYSSPLLTSAAVNPATRTGLERLVQAAAADRLPSVRAERSAIAATRVLPWHRSQRAARTSYVDYLDARSRYFSSVAGDVAVLWVRHPDLDRRLDAARTSFSAAAPGSADERRVRSAFGAPPAPGPGQ